MGKKAEVAVVGSCSCFRRCTRAENPFGPYRRSPAASDGFDTDNVVVSVTKGGGLLKKAGGGGGG